ncbi:MAG: T9SS type A sorting domain-containing protein [Saprospiraceae bacterium]|nr:T9SS type A sorting domain-containing protein [Saprospiraceae bacterium]
MLGKLNFSLLCCCLLASVSLRAQFDVTPVDVSEYRPEDLLANFCMGNNVEILEIAFEGNPQAVAGFDNALQYLGIDKGFILSTGAAATRVGFNGANEPVSALASANNFSTAFHPGILALANNTSFHDISLFRIRFRPKRDTVSFRYVFASEEYPDFVCSPFNDVFGFFLEGPDENGIPANRNLALVPGTSLPVSINSINNGTPGTHSEVNPDIYCTSPLGSLSNFDYFVAAQDYPVYNGYTTPLTAKAAVLPCQEYTMTLVIADIGDAFWDSAIFFEAGSLCSYDSGIQTNIDPRSPVLIEGCTQNPLQFSFEGYDGNDFPMSYSIAGTAENGSDYQLIPTGGSVGNNAFSLPIQAIDDGIAETPELVRVFVQVNECLADTFDLYIIDPLYIDGPATADCSGGPQSLNIRSSGVDVPEVWLDSLNYTWSNGLTRRNIRVFPQGEETYSVNFGNALNQCSASFTISSGAVVAEINNTLCSNEDGIVVNGTLYDLTNPQGVEIFPGENGCDSTVIINLSPAASGALNATICETESILVNGVAYNVENPDGIEILSGAATGGCDSVVTISLNFLPVSGSTLDASIQEGEVYLLGNASFSASGNYDLVLQNQFGCDSTVHLRLRVTPVSESLTDSIAIGQTNTICLDISHLNSVVSFVDLCEDSDVVASIELDAEGGYCVHYTGLKEGTEQVCLVICDEFFCDTTYLTISVFENLLDAVDDNASTVYGANVGIPVLANDWTSATTLTSVYLVSQPAIGTATLNPDFTVTFAPGGGACDETVQFSYAICNAIGCDTAQVFVELLDAIDLCSAVWPGDVRVDGLVNVIDYWAVGLSFNKTGPQRPNATIQWQPELAPNWSTTFTFIEETNRKHADCNGNGIINIQDHEAIAQNWGLTHPFLSGGEDPDFAKSFTPVALQQMTAEDNELQVALDLGAIGHAVEGFSGLGFRVAISGGTTDDFYFDASQSWAGIEDEDLETMVIPLGANTWYVAMVRTAKHQVSGNGSLGRLVFPSSWPETIQVTDLLMLLNESDIYELDPLTLAPEQTSTAVRETAGLTMQLFPNPATTVVQVKLPENIDGGVVQVLDLRGIILQEERLAATTHELDLSICPAGVYVVRVQTDGGFLQKKLVVRR